MAGPDDRAELRVFTILSIKRTANMGKTSPVTQCPERDVDGLMAVTLGTLDRLCPPLR